MLHAQGNVKYWQRFVVISPSSSLKYSSGSTGTLKSESVFSSSPLLSTGDRTGCLPCSHWSSTFCCTTLKTNLSEAIFSISLSKISLFPYPLNSSLSWSSDKDTNSIQFGKNWHDQTQLQSQTSQSLNLHNEILRNADWWTEMFFSWVWFISSGIAPEALTEGLLQM